MVTTVLAKRSEALFKGSHPSSSETISQLKFDYTQLPDTQEALSLKNKTIEIRILYKASVQTLAKIGHELNLIKEKLDYGCWLDWLNKEFVEQGFFTIDSARNYMNLSNLVAEHGLDSLKALPLSVLYIMGRSDFPEETRQLVIKQAQEERITKTRFKEIKALNQVTIGPAAGAIPKPNNLKVESQETVTYTKVDKIWLHKYNLCFFYFGLRREAYQHIDVKLLDIKLNASPNALICITTSPADSFSLDAKMLNLGFTKLAAVHSSRKRPLVCPDLNITSRWLMTNTYAIESNAKLPAMIQDSYSSSKTLLNSLITACAEDGPVNLLISSLNDNPGSELISEEEMLELAHKCELFIT